MRRFILLSAFVLSLPLSMMAQFDDMGFTPKKNKADAQTSSTYYCGSDRSVDDYNRRGHFKSRVQSVDGDDVIAFDGAEGIYPDSVYVDSLFQSKYDFNGFSRYQADDDDYRYSRQLDRWYGVYNPWFYGYFGYPGYSHYWCNPFFYSGYWGMYDPWYDPWFYGPGYYGWGGPWYTGWYGGWYNPWYYGYHGWYGYYGYYDPWYWGGGYGGGHVYTNYGRNGIAGTSNHGVASHPGRYTAGTGSTSSSSRFGNAHGNTNGDRAAVRPGSSSRNGTLNTINTAGNGGSSTRSASSSHSSARDNSSYSRSASSSFGSSSGSSFSGGSRGGSFGGGGHSGGSAGGGSRGGSFGGGRR